MRAIGDSLGTLPHRVNGFFNGHAFEDIVTKILKAAHAASSKAEIIARVVKEHAKFFANRVRSLTAKRDKFLRLAARCDAEATTLVETCKNGTIPMYSTKAALPQSPCARFAFFVLLSFALLLAIVEGLSFAWFMRFRADSLIFAIFWSSAVFAFPVFEAAFLHNRRITPRVQDIIMLIQGVFGAGAFAAYVYFSIVFADSSLVAAFSETSQGLSAEQLRMAFQIATCILFSGVCFMGAGSKLESTTIKNPSYKKALAEAKEKHLEAENYRTRAERCDGELDKIEARKDAQLRRCEQKLDELKAVDVAHTDSINRILSE